MSLAELFPGGDYRFHLTLRRAEPREFFAPRDATGRVRGERARWLASDPERYAAVLPEGEAAVREFAAVAAPWAHVASTQPGAMDTAMDAILRLGGVVEPDLLFLTADASGRFRLRAGALCFPTGWALTEKLGHTLDFIHDVVPGLNPALGASIQQFLAKLKPGQAFLRHNWGLAATDELNLHPARGLPPPLPPVALDRLWLRVEHQALLVLPESGAIAFGIRIALHRMDDVARDPAVNGLRRALQSMPADVAAYKRLDSIRNHLLNVL